MKKSLMNKFTLKILSLLIAILIWLLVMNIENPSITQTYTDIPVTFVNESYIESMNNIALMVDGKDSVNVRIRAVSDTIKKLNKENITAVADLTQIIDMDSDPIMVPVTVTCAGVDDENIEVTPKNIPIKIDERKNIDRIISTELIGESKPDNNYEVGKITANPEKINIVGPKSIIEKIDSVTAQVNVDGMAASGEREATLKIYDRNHDELSDKQMSYLKFDVPSTVIQVHVELWRMLKDVTIDASNSYVGSPQNGYQVDSVLATPSDISIVGSEEALQKFTVNGNKLTIPQSDERDITGKSSDCEFSVDLTELLPKDIKLATGVNDTALLTVKILPLNSKEYNISTNEMKIENSPANMNVVMDKVEVMVRVEGKEEDLDKLDKSQIHLSIDLKSYTAAGEYEVPVKIEVPDGYQVVDEIKVKVTLADANSNVVYQRPES